MVVKTEYRIRTIQLVFILCAFVLVIKAAQIQLFDTSFRIRADATAIEKHIIYPARGIIYDRNGKLLVNNDPMYDLMVTYNAIDPKMDTAKFCKLLGIDKKTFIENLDKDWKSKRFSKAIPFPFLKKISTYTYARFQESLWEFPGFFPQLRIARVYPHHNGANVLGYIREVDQQQIDKSNGLYGLGDYIGITGLEGEYEHFLMGRKGIQYIMKDNMGRPVGPYRGGAQDSIPISGFDMVSSIDLDLQKYAEDIMKGKRGSVVAIEPKTGEILAAVSSPTYDPNLLTVNQGRGKAFAALLQDYDKPLYNRIAQAKYPPGSIFKTVVGLAAMQMGVLTPNRSIHCPGAYYYRGGKIKCHHHPPSINVSHALQYSCNTYFITVLRDAVDKYGFTRPSKGLQELDNHLFDFGLGHPLGVDMMHETRGNIPTPEYYEKKYGKGWRSTYMMFIGIGQGEIQLSTLQIANLAAIIANRGYYYVPHLIKGFKNKKVLIPKTFREKHYSGVDTKYFTPVIEGMDAAVASKWCGWSTPIPGITMCGKTGTSQNPPYRDHAVFMAFAPKEDPKIAIAVLIENAGFGAQSAAPIASLIVEKYLRGYIEAPYRQEREKEMTRLNLLGPPQRDKK
ncbi:MAG: penicillin-binding protein 2 [Saprospiraceae bacterium]|nr:penicillin-binding protein 2 [Saprospiraceae bacterium]